MSLRRLAIAALVVPLTAACWGDLVTDETIGSRPDPSGGGMFRNYVAIGTSIGAGIQSGGINDSTQKEAYTYRLAAAMGLVPGTDWHYPSLTVPGCPPPYTNILTGTRLSTVSCAYRAPASAFPFMNNVSVPSIRAAQVLDIGNLDFPGTDSLKLVQFITGSRNPMDMAEDARPSFVTLEIGANDVLGAATRGDTTLLTTLASLQTSFTTVADRIDATGADVAVMNVPNVTRIPHFSLGLILYCLKNGCASLGVSATLPYSLPTFTADVSCVPSALGGVGDSMLTTFSTTATITGVLAAGGLASLNCGTGAATVTTALGTAPAGPTITKSELKAIAARVASFNSFIASQATARGWALANADSALAANAAQIPLFPGFSTPSTLFGALFSLDGIHPNRAGHAIVALVFRNAINAKFGASLAVP